VINITGDLVFPQAQILQLLRLDRAAASILATGRQTAIASTRSTADRDISPSV
jgi:hypothetical protein